jgi:predicted nucleic acid-binding protein
MDFIVYLICQVQKTRTSSVILSCDDKTCWYWAQISAIKGHPMPCGDAWIAATALRYNTPLITHNVKDFEHLKEKGLSLITVPNERVNKRKLI